MDIFVNDIVGGKFFSGWYFGSSGVFYLLGVGYEIWYINKYRYDYFFLVVFFLLVFIDGLILFIFMDMELFFGRLLLLVIFSVLLFFILIFFLFVLGILLLVFILVICVFREFCLLVSDFICLFFRVNVFVSFLIWVLMVFNV